MARHEKHLKKLKKLKIESPLYGAHVMEIEGRQRARAHRASFQSTRRAVHRGTEIKVRTTYRVEIDGEPVRAYVSVGDDGMVYCHGLPNYSFSSALDMARAIVDASRLARYEVDEIGCGDTPGADHDDGEDA